jgi:DNA-binding response OmpR family regulator
MPTSKKILIVEDNENISELLYFILIREGYEVSQANTGQEAKDFIEEATPHDLILLDIMLPFIDGFQLLNIIRNTPDWKSVPIIMLSAKTQENDVVKALNNGANDYMYKPFQPGELIARVKRYL